MMNCPNEKAELRKRLKMVRDSITSENHAEWSQEICKHIAKLCVSRRIRRVGAFWPFGSEVDLRPLVESNADWIFVFPRVASTHPPRLVWGPEPLEPGLFGLMEPVHAQHFMPPVQLLLIPGLAFDCGGYRIGYGGGFYDALLDRLDSSILTLGVGYSVQMVSELPQDPLDQPVQGIVTEIGVKWINSEDV
ncbi:MAG: 5-formyltetrahydrofolate cyclo-ligase [Holophagaceae bacterium]|nr:5-formyltetrahydrofolate cyclo-ligase [Holophagaceae bacterium]